MMKAKTARSSNGSMRGGWWTGSPPPSWRNSRSVPWIVGQSITKHKRIQVFKYKIKKHFLLCLMLKTMTDAIDRDVGCSAGPEYMLPIAMIVGAMWESHDNILVYHRIRIGKQKNPDISVTIQTFQNISPCG